MRMGFDKASPVVRRWLGRIASHGHVSAIELMEEARREGLDPKGTLSFEIKSLNVVLWAGLSSDACDALDELRETKMTEIHAASLLVYLADGGMLGLPLVKKVPKKGYKKPHWAPIVWHHDPMLKETRDDISKWYWDKQIAEGF